MDLEEKNEFDQQAFQFLLTVELVSAAYNKAAKLIYPHITDKKMNFEEVRLLSKGHIGNMCRTLQQPKFNKGNLKGCKNQISLCLYVYVYTHTQITESEYAT